MKIRIVQRQSNRSYRKFLPVAGALCPRGLWITIRGGFLLPQRGRIMSSDSSNTRSSKGSERRRGRNAECNLDGTMTVTNSDKIQTESRGAAVGKEAPADSSSDSNKYEHDVTESLSDSAKFSRTLRWLQLCVFIDYFGVSLVVPLLPSYFRAAGLNGEAVGFIASLYYLSQVVGGAVIGVLSDIVPRRDVLILSFLGSAISYYIVGHAPTLWLLFASRAIVGLVKHTMTISSALVTEGGDEGGRAANIGRIHAYSTLAFIIGPSIGSLLYKEHPSYPCLVSTALFVGNAALCYTVIPRKKYSRLDRTYGTNSGEDDSKDGTMTGTRGKRGKSVAEWFRDIRSSVTSLRDRGMFIHLTGILSIVFIDRAMSINNMLSYLEIRYNIPAYQIGFVASVTSVFGFVAQYALVDKAVKFFGSEQRAITSCLFLVAIVSYGEYFCSSIYDYVYFIVPVTTICSNIILTCNRSSISKLVSSDHVGKLLSMLNILDAVAGVAAPVYGAELFSRTGYLGRAPAASLHYFLLAVLISRLHTK